MNSEKLIAAPVLIRPGQRFVWLVRFSKDIAVSYNLHITLRCIDSIKQSFERHPFYWQATLEKSEYYSESVRSSIS
jgi:hypothetical protein